MTKQYFSVAIDGPAGAGKSTIARRAANELGFVYMDTGAIYRTVAHAALSAGVDPRNPAAVSALLPSLTILPQWDQNGVQHMILNDTDVSAMIRSPEVSQSASVVAAIPSVRDFLLETQRKAARMYRIIMDGRDIGTVVLPDADVKIYLTASAEVRAKRRWIELQERKAPDTYEQVLQDMIERDHRDMNREIAPLRQAEDAVLVDTSSMSLEESIEAVISVIQGAISL